MLVLFFEKPTCLIVATEKRSFSNTISESTLNKATFRSVLNEISPFLFTIFSDSLLWSKTLKRLDDYNQKLTSVDCSVIIYQSSLFQKLLLFF